MADAHAVLIDSLTRELRPVAPLPAVWRQLAVWLAAVAWVGLLLSLFTDFSSMALRLGAAPDMWISFAASVSTAVVAGWAALQLSIPGRSGKWAFTPFPPLAIWLGASAAGCLRLTPVAGVKIEPSMHPIVCLHFLLLVSIPLSGLLAWQSLKACPLRPGLTAALGGLASAAASAALLSLVHPFDATVEDLSVHFAAVLCIVAFARLWGGRAFRNSATSLSRPFAG